MLNKFTGFLLRRYQVPPLEQSQNKLTSWLNTPWGQLLYEAERRVSKRDVCKTPGHRIMQLGCSPEHSLIDTQGHAHKFILAPTPGGTAVCIAEFHELPLPSKTLDTVMLHHALDFSTHPHELLKEAARVVNDGGYLIIVGFNPFSLFGVSKWLGGLLTGQPIWRHHSLRRARLVDWLYLIGFEATTVDSRPRGALDRSGGSIIGRIARWWRWHTMARAFYVLVARQRSLLVTPARQGTWQPVKIPALQGLNRADDTRSK